MRSLFQNKRSLNWEKLGQIQKILFQNERSLRRTGRSPECKLLVPFRKVSVIRFFLKVYGEIEMGEVVHQQHLEILKLQEELRKLKSCQSQQQSNINEVLNFKLYYLFFDYSTFYL